MVPHVLTDLFLCKPEACLIYFVVRKCAERGSKLCKIDKRFYAKQTLSFVSEFVMIMSIKRDNGLPETVNLILKTTCILEHKNYEGWHK